MIPLGGSLNLPSSGRTERFVGGLPDEQRADESEEQGGDAVEHDDRGVSGEPDQPQDDERAAQRLMALLDAAGTAAGKYTVDLRGAQGVQVGDRNIQTNTLRASP